MHLTKVNTICDNGTFNLSSKVGANKMKVAIAGAGLSGLVALKECLAEGIEADVFEAADQIGGQWAYGTEASSMYEGVVLNSCRDTSGFTDFPLDPARYPHFLSHQQFREYIEEYTNFFGLKRHIKLNTRVKNCRQVGDKWEVETDGKAIYDAVFACTGHDTIPSIPDFPGKSSFKGQFVHSHFYRRPSDFEGKRVAIIGIGSSAADISCELVGHAKEVHIITRRGSWILPRLAFGKPVEYLDSRAAQQIVPSAITNTVQKLLMDFIQGKHPPELIPNHKMLEAHPTIRGDFLEKCRADQIKIHRAGIEEIVPTGIKTTNGEIIEVDTIISCTGYKVDFPYLPRDTYRPKTASKTSLDTENAINLYELIHPVEYRNLFFIGLIEVPGPHAPVSELQVRWSIGLLTGRIPRLSPKELAEGVAWFQADQAKHFVHSARHTLASPVISYCDRIAAPLGADPTFAKLCQHIFASGQPLRSLRLLNAVYNSVPSLAQYRLFGYGNFQDLATEQLLRLSGSNKQLTKKEKEWIQSGKEFPVMSSKL